ncbi:MAG: hypothetical protein R3C16_06445 [Hyphomonadaceae bacterium]
MLPGGTLQDGARTLSVFKYDGSYGSIDESPPFTTGPNRGCPTPIVPLTTNHTTVSRAIDNMRVVSAGGTNSAVGLVWGWRVLSPGAPFTEGRDPEQEDVRKVIVFMTDGENTNMNMTSEDGVLQSPYNAFGFRGQWTNFQNDVPVAYRRNIGNSESSYVNYVDTTGCATSARTSKTTMSRSTPSSSATPSQSIRTLLRNCATDREHAYTAENAQDLQDVFHAIGSGIGRLRITR